MGLITTDQSHQVLATLAVNADWASIDFEGSALQNLIIRNPKEAGRQFTAFLKNGGRIHDRESKVITLDRGRFNPVEFIGGGWSVIPEETDTRSTVLTELDLTKVRHVTMLRDGETRVGGEEKLKRLKKDGHIRLDADVFYTLWVNQHLIPEGWKEKVNGNTLSIFFDGTILRSSYGRRFVLFLYWISGNKWCWNIRWLDDDWHARNPSAVLTNLSA